MKKIGSCFPGVPASLRPCVAARSLFEVPASLCTASPSHNTGPMSDMYLPSIFFSPSPVVFVTLLRPTLIVSYSTL